MKKFVALLGAVTALALSMPASAAIISIISFPPGAGFFALGDTAFYGASVSGPFDDIFTFSVSQSGTSTFSLTTSGGDVTFSSITFNTKSLPLGLSGMGVAGPDLTAFATDTIELKGTSAGTGPFSGTVTFTPGVVPEPATWATFLLGFGFLGLGLRRRSARLLAA